MRDARWGDPVWHDPLLPAPFRGDPPGLAYNKGRIASWLRVEVP